jgi:diguanylate cyclase (GGDEF)-like protein
VYANSWDIVSSLDTLDRRTIINTYKELIASPAVYSSNPEIQKIPADVLTEDYLINVVVIPETNILTLTVEGPDPKLIVLIADAIGNQALDYINRLYPVYNFSVLDEPTMPTRPIRPEPVKNAGLALLLGAVLGIGLAFSREQLQYSFERLRERSIIDPVTNAFIRAHFEKRLREDVMQNPDASLSLGLINFRGIEESAGVLPQSLIDRAMQHVTQKLKSELRGRDIIGRWDRSQLSVLLASAPSSAIESTFKRIQKYLEEPIQLSETGDVTIRPDPCIGVVSRNQFESGDTFVERAKTAMGQASSFGAPTVVYVSTPFIFDNDLEQL